MIHENSSSFVTALLHILLPSSQNNDITPKHNVESIPLGQFQTTIPAQPYLKANELVA